MAHVSGTDSSKTLLHHPVYPNLWKILVNRIVNLIWTCRWRRFLFLSMAGLMPAVRLSDHSSFWDKGIKAVMITGTAFYRNPHYHLKSDTMGKIQHSSQQLIAIRKLLI